MKPRQYCAFRRLAEPAGRLGPVPQQSLAPGMDEAQAVLRDGIPLFPQLAEPAGRFGRFLLHPADIKIRGAQDRPTLDRRNAPVQRLFRVLWQTFARGIYIAEPPLRLDAPGFRHVVEPVGRFGLVLRHAVA